jgi:hypothetical protein
MDEFCSHTGDCEDGASYCDDLFCWCHSDVSYHDTIQHPVYDPASLVLAYDFYDLPFPSQEVR